MLVAQGKLDEALKAYRDGLAITERLAAADRSNTLWQSDLSLSYHNVGDVLVAQGKLDEALKGIVTLMNDRRDKSCTQSRSCRGGDLAPCLHGRGSERPVRLC